MNVNTFCKVIGCILSFIALICSLLLFYMGVAVWTTEEPWLFKLAGSLLGLFFGVAGSFVGIFFMKELITFKEETHD